MFWARAISFPLLLAIFFAMIFWSYGAWIFAILVPFLLGMAGYEFGKIIQKFDLKCSPKVIGAILFILGAAFAPISLYGTLGKFDNVTFFCYFGIPFLGVFVSFAGMFFAKDRKSYFIDSFTSFGCVLFLTFLYIPLLGVYAVDAKDFLYLVLVTKMTDTGGYIFGKLSSFLPGGNHKIAPRFSPKKSYEGLAGGMLMSVAAGLILLKYGCSPFNTTVTIISSLVLSLGSFAGDLSESALKREADIKDSANWIPGMGGIFDVLDSFIYNGIIFLVFMVFWR